MFPHISVFIVWRIYVICNSPGLEYVNECMKNKYIRYTGTKETQGNTIISLFLHTHII